MNPPGPLLIADAAPRVTTSPVVAPPTTSVSECTVSTRRETATTSTKPPPRQAAATRPRGDTGTTRSTSTAVTVAAIATATWPEGNSRSGSPCRWRCMSSLSSSSAARVAGAADRASTPASRRPASHAKTAPATMIMSITGSKVPETIAATPPAWEWASSCQRITPGVERIQPAGVPDPPGQEDPDHEGDHGHRGGPRRDERRAGAGRAGHRAVRARHAGSVAARPATE